MNSNKFLVDSNVLIQAKNTYYAFDVCEGFWNSLIKHSSTGNIVTIQNVFDEIMSGGDDLSDWVGDKFPSGGILNASDTATQKSYGKLIDWVQDSSQFKASAKDEYARVADGWLMAFAHAHGYTVVTHEAHIPNVRKRVPIPNVCKQFSIPYTNTFQMLRALSISFVCS